MSVRILKFRSSWTEIPQDKANKNVERDKPEIDLKKEAERQSLKKRDKEQEERIKKIKRSSDSLLDMHVKKMKEKKKVSINITKYSSIILIQLTFFTYIHISFNCY